MFSIDFFERIVVRRLDRRMRWGEGGICRDKTFCAQNVFLDLINYADVSHIRLIIGQIYAPHHDFNLSFIRKRRKLGKVAANAIKEASSFSCVSLTRNQIMAGVLRFATN